MHTGSAVFWLHPFPDRLDGFIHHQIRRVARMVRNCFGLNEVAALDVQGWLYVWMEVSPVNRFRRRLQMMQIFGLDLNLAFPGVFNQRHT